MAWPHLSHADEAQESEAESTPISAPGRGSDLFFVPFLQVGTEVSLCANWPPTLVSDLSVGTGFVGALLHYLLPSFQDISFPLFRL